MPWTNTQDIQYVGAGGELDANEELLVQSLDSLATSGASEAVRKASSTTVANVSISSGSGDVSGPASSVDNEIALFSGAGGKTIKRASTTGLLKAASGVISAAVPGTDYYAPGSSLEVDDINMTGNIDGVVDINMTGNINGLNSLEIDEDLNVTGDANVSGDLSVTGPITTNAIKFNAPQGYMVNGKLSITVASNNITVALKTLAGSDPSAADPVYCRIGDTVRTVAAALSVTKNAGTNWFNAGSSELATNEIDYFAYLGYNATDGVVIGFSRVYSTSYGQFSATSTNEKYCAISTITNAASTDYYEIVGRFAATLSATASFNWSVPTYTARNLIQRPIHETRFLAWTPTITGYSANPTSTSYRYKIVRTQVQLLIREGANGTSNATTTTYTIPLATTVFNGEVYAAPAGATDNGASVTVPAMLSTANSSVSVIDAFKDWASGAWTNSGGKRIRFAQFNYEYTQS